MIDYEKLQPEIRAWAIEKGWLEPEAEPRAIDGLLMLVVTEVAESVEAWRAGNPACERPGMEHLTHVAEELADVVIRLVQMADEWGFKIGQPFVACADQVERDAVQLHWLIVRRARALEVCLQSPVADHDFALGDIFSTVEFVAGQLDVDLAEAVRLKMQFNWTRPTKHGKTC